MRRPDTTATHPVAEVCEFGVLREWPSVKACAADLGMSSSGVILAIKEERRAGRHAIPCSIWEKSGFSKKLKKILKKWCQYETFFCIFAVRKETTMCRWYSNDP